MDLIYWLDDDPRQIEVGVRALRSAGYEVKVFTDEGDVKGALARGELPKLLIQDLEREGVVAGWILYEKVLKPNYPQLPVLICSYDAYFKDHRDLAEDYNLVLLDKEDNDLANELVPQVAEVIRSQILVLASRARAPLITALDFETVNSALLKHLAAHPGDVHRVGWAAFEALVARILEELGYRVTRTPLTRDGGVDLWALQRSDLGETLYAIDAKKYSPGRILGPEPVRAIHGVASMAGASAGMIVTTGRFGPAAKDLASQFRYRISLKDCDDLVSWIRKVGV